MIIRLCLSIASQAARLVAAASAFPDADAAAALTRAGIPQSPGPLVAWKPELDEIHSLNEPGEWLWIFSPGGGRVQHKAR